MTELFLTFAKIGVMTFGGGVAMLPILQREIVDKHHWASEEEMLDYTALSQSAPGAIAVNAAILVGWKIAGLSGMIAAVLGTILPPMIVLSSSRGSADVERLHFTTRLKGRLRSL